MGLRSWLLGFDPEEVKALKAEVKELRARVEQVEKLRVKLGLTEEKLRAEILEVLKALDRKADKVDLEDVRLRLNSLMKTLDALTQQIEALNISLKRDQILATEERQKELILRLILEGYNTPSELKRVAPFGSKKLYEILRELEREGLVEKIKRGRRVYYVSSAETKEG
ncbi:helix-turn-helix domain-containing protein [Archaeoglobus sp.]